MRSFRSFSSRETQKLGSELARRILKKYSRNRATVVALVGPLGAGKTTFIQGFFKGLGLKKRAASPTFIIIRRVGLKKKHFIPLEKSRPKAAEAARLRRGRSLTGFRNIYHIDAYRLKKDADLLSLGFGDIAKSPENILLIEWADKVRKIIPRGAMWIRLRHGKKEYERIITL